MGLLKLMASLHRTVAESLRDLLLTLQISQEYLLENISKLQVAPLMTTIRINTINIDPVEALEQLKEMVALQNPEFRVSICEKIPYLAMIDALGPYSVQPKPDQVIVSMECGQAVLRGSDVFVPGVLAIQDDFKQIKDVSVWADLDGKCTKGLRKNYAGRKHYLGNGILMTVFSCK